MGRDSSLRRLRILGTGAVLAMGCARAPGDGDSDSGTEGETDTGTTDAGDGDGDGDGEACASGMSVFDEELMHEIRIELSDADWAAMIEEAENSPEYGGPPKTYFPADLIFDGTQVATIGIRLKGHYSLLTAIGHEFPLKLDFDRYVVDQELDGLKKLNLHPTGEYESPVREYLSYGALRDYGVPTARTAFAHLSVNEEDLGLYDAVEQIDGGFIKCHFEAPHGDLYKPEEPGGNLFYEGPSIDDYPTANHKWPDQTDHAAFLAMVDAVNNGPLDGFADVLDVTGVLTYLAGNVAVGNFDYYASYGHNYYLYESTPGRFTMLPWDMNLSQIELWHPCGAGRNTEEWPVSHRLLADEQYTAEYAEIMSKMLEGPMSVDALNDRLDRALEVAGDDISAEVEEELRFAFEYRVDMLLAGLPELVICPVSTE